ncbi:peptidylprolyl isomerase [Micromonospora sp. NPDC049051]|uniref:peptidylprolyl isomerase n=1 Tax=Micromonospora sp. NPDC049051 TaxID=3364264 RepID=UPI00371915FC
MPGRGEPLGEGSGGVRRAPRARATARPTAPAAHRIGNANEYLPTDDRPAYPAGVVALADSGPDTNGSQFFLIYQDVQLEPNYTVLGKMDDASIEVVKKATEAGHDGAFGPNPGGATRRTTSRSRI